MHVQMAQKMIQYPALKNRFEHQHVKKDRDSHPFETDIAASSKESFPLTGSLVGIFDVLGACHRISSPCICW